MKTYSYTLLLPNDCEGSTANELNTTKRSILKFVMSVFDPLGLISNLLVHGKMIIQDLWRTQVGWDEPIPAEILINWQSLESLQLHVFVDASESAFACVAYFRVVDHSQPRCTLIASKAKVAPLKPLSVPRLELQAAVIGSRLAKSIADYHTVTISQRFFWSDSRTVLSWINSDARKYRQYVAVRIGEILEESQPEEWRWIPTKLNVADEATKWGKGPTLSSNSRWFSGPDFLLQAENEWPQHQISASCTEEELRTIHVHHVTRVQPCIEYGRFSKWERMLRTTAYVYSFMDSCCGLGKRGAMQARHQLKSEDFVRAERALWRIAQADEYAEEILILRKANTTNKEKAKELNRDSPIRQLSPFLDEYGVVRMEGRTEASPLSTYDAKYPVILPKNHRVSELIVDYYHRRLGHHNSETVVNEVRQRYHISTLRTLVRKVTKKCQWCTVYKAQPVVPRMAPLPEVRVTPFVRPFSLVGIDYFGPYMIKIGRSQVKRWVALFTCLVIRAVHLEAIASLSTESCKLALRRFISRRGAPTQIYTDHGTNFVGASRELAQQTAAMNRELAESFTDANTRWNFIPPSSPHMGGAWERMVRAVKIAMESVNHSRAPSEEVFHTILCDAESMVNSRPLMYVPLETSDQEALTPNHFILLSSNGVKQPKKVPTIEGKVWLEFVSLCSGSVLVQMDPRIPSGADAAHEMARRNPANSRRRFGLHSRGAETESMASWEGPKGNPAGLKQHYGEGNVAAGVTSVDALNEILHRDGPPGMTDPSSGDGFDGVGKTK
ncbi:uncharacterized protein LOC134202221 [Armigeres subalbatus]|uniref:uncharacterized protein LOC134202221 n=1 Tax=Armigeres subalbatus TaxID=124917 RepID=UPI002ED1EFFA